MKSKKTSLHDNVLSVKDFKSLLIHVDIFPFFIHPSLLKANCSNETTKVPFSPFYYFDILTV